jgi:hypothetical protein
MILLSTDWLIDDADKELASRALGGVGDESLDFLVFCGDIEVAHIDLSQAFDYSRAKCSRPALRLRS